jgi:TldD protein
LLSSAPNVLESSAFVERSSSRRRLLTSEGTWADETYNTTRIDLQAIAQADDGMLLEADIAFTGKEPSTLPSSEVMEAKTKEALARLAALRVAQLAEGGTAIVLFEGVAAAQLVEALLAPRLLGAPPLRLAGTTNDRSLASRLGLEVVSPELDVFDDPTLKTGPRGEPLWGNYAADDEGVPARRVSLIERGVLKTLLMSRSPRKEVRQSNGHYCSMAGVAIGNLFVKAARPLSRTKLLALAEREAKKRGPQTKVYVVRRLAQGRGIARMAPWLFIRSDIGLSPERGMVAAEAYLVTGGKERPVRGLALESMELRSLKELLAAGDDAHVMNVELGCSSSIVAPSLLLPNIDVTRDEGNNPNPPSYPPPP